MAGIRVCSVDQSLGSENLHKHFSSSKHGGGSIQKLYHPLLSDDAVVIFKETSTVDTVVSCGHKIGGTHSVSVHRLPSYQVFRCLDAYLESDVSSYIQATDKLAKLLQDTIGLKILEDTNETIKLRGTWYQLEQAWKVLDDFMVSQHKLHCTITSGCPNSVAGSHKSQSKTDIQNTTKASLKGPLSASRAVEGSAKSSTELKSKLDIKSEVPKENSKSSNDKEAVQDIGGKTATKDDQNGAEDAKTRKDSKEKIDISTAAAANSGDSGLIDTKCAEDMSSLEFTVDGVKAVVYYGNIVKASTNAIVNAAMGSLVNAGGVAMAIADAAGSKMQKECDDFVKKHGKLGTADVIHTCAGGKLDKRVKHVIHTVGPIWSDTRDSEKCAHELTETFLNCLSYADSNLKLESITMPVISSGIFGVPLEICLKAFLEGFLIFTLEKTSLREVHVASNDPNVNLTSIIFLQELMQNPLSQLRLTALKSFKERETIQGRPEKSNKKGNLAKTKSSRKSDSLNF
ncbi:hypothetical protein ACJMK2_006613 [Sinanodonta woodiana]|uniref:Macro domain-containing protein n=1 Tax=Sinanodonta woodiana TaxID=1069815 RepID=A0ABD3VWT9_SINWO